VFYPVSNRYTSTFAKQRKILTVYPSEFSIQIRYTFSLRFGTPS